jgi:hypothetical protein
MALRPGDQGIYALDIALRAMAPRIATWLDTSDLTVDRKGSARCSNSWSLSPRVAMTRAGGTTPMPTAGATVLDCPG